MPRHAAEDTVNVPEAEVPEAEETAEERKVRLLATLHAPRVSAEDRARAAAKAAPSVTTVEARLPWSEVAVYLSPVVVAFETKVDYRGASFIATTGGKGEQAVCTEAALTEDEEEAYVLGATGRLVTIAGLDRDGELAILALHSEDPEYGLEAHRNSAGDLVGTFALVGDTTCTKYFGLKAKYGGMVARKDVHKRTDLA